MASYRQQDRSLILTTPLGKDVLLVTSFQGHESISHLFEFEIQMLAERDVKIPFDQILGQTVTLEMSLLNGDKRYFNALVKQFSQRGRDENFVGYHAWLTPSLWLLAKKVQSRIFQHVTVPDILHKVLAGLDVNYELAATYHPRDYCVQYGESDFDFASRLMEEEGIYYFFKHSDGSHQMVVTDLPGKHPTVPGQNRVIYEEISGETRTDMRIHEWEKFQRVRAGEFTSWDYCFELPDKHLEATEKTIPTVTVGKVTHKLNVGHNEQLEIYQYPGGYAQRFDGITSSGGAQAQDLNNIYTDRARTVRIRMEQEEVESLEIRGKGDCGHFTAGHEFTLERHFDADDTYLLTRIEHNANQGDYRTGQTEAFAYENRFTCIPDSLHYRPQQKTPKPVISGLQTAVVTGPSGEEIFVDKYGRVKVQFHWDREGKLNADSSCWLRVAQVWAGSGWGAFFWPRIGHEVVVLFEEGDPDKPMIVGSVYNAKNMPWYLLPANKQLAGIKSASERGKAHKNYNGIVFNDEKGKEHLSIHSEHNLSLNSEANKMTHAGGHKGERVGVANVLTVGKFIPVGGGSGGGFDEGNPMPSPPPSGIVGLNSTFVFGDNMQAACPLNHQLAIGNNVQLCINPFGLAAGSPGTSVPETMQALIGSGMGGSMQFTIGSSAQFTLGQSYEISIGPPKIEIHAQYKDHLGIGIACGVVGIASVVFMIAYDLLKAQNDSWMDDKVAASGKEQSGDQERAGLVLVYQLLTDVLLTAILSLESAADKTDWQADNTMKDLYKTDQQILDLWKAPSAGPDKADEPWSETGMAVVGAVGIAAAIVAEIALMAAE